MSCSLWKERRTQGFGGILNFRPEMGSSSSQTRESESSYFVGKYPILSSLARKYLYIPATSVPSERAFSIAGHIVNRRIACLNPDSVNMLVFFS